MTIENPLVQIGHLQFDTQQLALYDGNRDLELRKQCALVLKCLWEHPGGVTFEQLKEEAWRRKGTQPPTDKTVRNTVTDLRDALGPVAGPWIANRPGRGYILRIPKQSAKRSLATGACEQEVTSVFPVAPSVSRQTKIELLRRYYPDEQLASYNLFRFAYMVDGTSIETNIVSSPEWLNICIPIFDPMPKAFLVIPPTVPIRGISDEQIEALRNDLHGKEIIFHNKPFYRLESFLPNNDESVIASFSMGQYADYKIEFGMLEQELIDGLLKSDEHPVAAFRSRSTLFPIRERRLKDAQRIASYSSRICAGGTDVLLAFRTPHDEGYRFSVRRRSANVSTGQGVFGLLPSGMHQPTNLGNAREESSIGCTVLRETLEEMFGYEELEGTDRHMSPSWFLSEPPLKWFEENEVCPRMEITSFGFNLVDGTYAFSVLFVVDDVRYWKEFRREMTPNNEFFEGQETPFISTLDKSTIRAILTEGLCADSSLFSLIEGLKRLQSLSADRVDLPNLE